MTMPQSPHDAGRTASTTTSIGATSPTLAQPESTDDGARGAAPDPHIGPLTSLQEGMLLAARLSASTGDDVEQLTMDLHEAIDIDRFRAAWHAVVQRHPALRTSFDVDRDPPTQRVVPAWEPPIVVVDWRHQDVALTSSAFLLRDRETAFVPSVAPPLRLLVARCSEERTWVCWTFHHALLDGRSFAIILGDVFAQYDGEAAHPTSASLSFVDFAAWQRAHQRASASEAQAFWRARLSGKTTPTPLPSLPGPTRHERTDGHGEWSVTIAPATVALLRGRAAKAGVSLGVVLQAAWALCLNRLTHDDDVLFGVSRAGRRGYAEHQGIPASAIDVVAGFFVQTLPLRVAIDDEEDVDALFRRLAHDARAVRPFEYSALWDIAAASGVPPGTPLLSTLLMFENRPWQETLRAQSPAFAARFFHVHEQPTFPLAMTLFHRETDVLELRVLFERARFADVGVRRLARWFETVLLQLAQAEKTKDVRLLSDDERARVLFAFNETLDERDLKTRVPSTGDVLVQDFFEAQVDAHQAAGTDDIAVVAGGTGEKDDQRTYRDLETAANRLAHYLRRRGAAPGQVVGVLLPRGIDLVVALLAVAKSGAAWVPLDCEHPPSRIRDVLTSAHPLLVLTEKIGRNRLPDDVDCVVLDDPDTSGDVGVCPSLRPSRLASTNDIAYILFTSGSTGRPKGVVVTHEAVVSTIVEVLATQGMTAKDRLLFVTSPSFDLSVFDVFGMLGVGASLRVASAVELAEPALLATRVTSGEVTVWNSAPALLVRMLPELAEAAARKDAVSRHRMRLVMLSGDWVPVTLPRQLRAIFSSTLAVTVLGGATEAAIWSNAFSVEAQDERWSSIPYGRPLRNARYHVLDRRLHPVPPGIAGDLYIGGPCLAQGYLGPPSLTAERFLPDPFEHEARARGVHWPTARGGDAHASPTRLYKTGDRARYFDDDGPLRGQIEFLGRADLQVKIRGVRVEPAEVESVLAEVRGVREVACAPRVDQTGEKVLCAWVSVGVKDGVSTAMLRAHAAARLPPAMVPSHIVLLTESLPLNASGKVDRAALPEPQVTSAPSVPERMPRTPTERELLGLWQEVLGLRSVGMDDDFFASGGHSMSATTLLRRVREHLGVRVPLSSLLTAPTVTRLAAVIEEQRAPKSSPSPSEDQAGLSPPTPNASSTARRLSPDLLVPLSAGGAGAPLLLIAGIGGHVFTFSSLAARLSRHRPVWGLRAIGSEWGEEPMSKVEDIASTYVAQLRARGLVDTPIVVGGYSFGGLVAFEVARQLVSHGREVARVVLFDALAPGYPEKLSLRERARLHVQELKAADRRERGTWVLDRLGRLHRRAQDFFGVPQDPLEPSPRPLWGSARQNDQGRPSREDFQKVVGGADLDAEGRQQARALWRALTKAQERYVPTEVLHTSGLVVRASEPPRWLQQRGNDDAHGWRRWLSGVVDVVVVPGTHLRLFEGENPVHMAQALTHSS
jgi:amino acid adenylation domain-containing protein